MNILSCLINVTGAYRYGFKGKEKDLDMDGNNYDYGFRIYNPQIRRFLSTDSLMKKYPELTPYQFAINSPILYIDLDGLEKVLSFTTANSIEKISQTMSPDPKKVEITTYNITYENNKSKAVKRVRLIHFSGGLDIDNDGSPFYLAGYNSNGSPTYRSISYPDDQDYDRTTAFGIIDANTVPYVTAPYILTHKYHVAGKQLAFISGSQRNSKSELVESATVGDVSGYKDKNNKVHDHGGEASSKAVRDFGYARNASDAPKRKRQYNYWYFVGVKIGTDPNVIKNSAVTKYFRKILDQVKSPTSNTRVDLFSNIDRQHQNQAIDKTELKIQLPIKY